MSPDDAAVVAAQLGRRPRGSWTVADRCPRGMPTAIAVAPLLEDGSPFPTTFWLTCPLLVDAAGEAESTGEHARYARRIASEADLALAALRADASYREARSALAAGEDPCASVGVAGQRDPLKVKCLHARVAASLAGIPDPIGDDLLRRWAPRTAGCDGGPCRAGRALESDLEDRMEREERAGVATMRRVAAIDIGTVTTRLLIADTDGREVREVTRITTVTHLGEGLRASGRLSEAGIGRVAEQLARFADEITRSGAEAVFAIATSAARDANNARDLVHAAAAHGIELRVIPGALEAKLSFTGATYGLDGEGFLVDDLGGGSTELVYGAAHDAEGVRVIDIEAARSVDVGSRRVLDAFLHSDPPTAQEQAAASAWIVEEMRPFFDGLRDRPDELITLAGTGTTLSAISQGLAVYDAAKVHGSRLCGADVAALRAELAGMTLAERREVVGMDPARADVIVAGSIVLETIMALAGVDETVVSEHDILYGIVLAGAAELA